MGIASRPLKVLRKIRKYIPCLNLSLRTTYLSLPYELRSQILSFAFINAIHQDAHATHSSPTQWTVRTEFISSVYGGPWTPHDDHWKKRFGCELIPNTTKLIEALVCAHPKLVRDLMSMMPSCLDMGRKGAGKEIARVVWKAMLERHIDLLMEGKDNSLIRLVEALEVGVPGYEQLFWPDDGACWRQYLSSLRAGGAIRQRN